MGFSLTLHMVSSLDGKIAKKDQSMAWFETTSPYPKGVEGEDPEAFLKTIDCYVMGSHTYELAVELAKTYGWAYGNTPLVVLTQRTLPKFHSQVEFHTGSLDALMDLLKANYQNVWAVGGSALAKSLIEAQCVDEVWVSILPIILGEGLPYFDAIENEQLVALLDVKAYKNGMVELRYQIKK
ncbi:MAG: dihydrofolate reductase family protein [Flavobacteriaceae bacterium]